MNATLFNGGKVHLVVNDATRCGVTKGRKSIQWQMELGDVTCRRCVRLSEKDSRKGEQSASRTGQSLTADERRFTDPLTPVSKRQCERRLEYG